MINDKDLVGFAWEARERAAASYSGYKVGAALLSQPGRVFSGVNVESSSYGLSCCAERVALFKAISEGETKFTKIAIAASGPLTPVPCGACRQLLADYARDVVILLSSKPGEFERLLLADIFPRPFSAEFLK